MPQAIVTMQVRPMPASVSIIDIQGDVTGTAENALTDAYTQASVNARTIALNFTGLEYMNSSGIGLLVMLLIRAQRHKQKLVAFGLSEHYQEIFELTRLKEAITLYSTEPEMLAAVR